MSAKNLYYRVKPYIPRSVQIQMRRVVVQQQRRKSKHVWPIDENAGKLPEGWRGWPDNKSFALVLTHDVDTGKGMERCASLMDIEMGLGFRSSFNFVPERYNIPPQLRRMMEKCGFEVGIHGLNHDGNMFRSRAIFEYQSFHINRYLKDWGVVGFRAPLMYHHLEWIQELDIEYDTSTFDTDPFEPQPYGVGTIFPFWVSDNNGNKGYVELPYTLPQDFTLFVLMREKNIDIWKKKLDWIVDKGGMVLMNTHPDYMNFDEGKSNIGLYPVKMYSEFLEHIRYHFDGKYFHALPRDLSSWFVKKYVI